MQESKTILYLDDNEDHRDLLKFIFEDAGYNILTCSSKDKCFDYLNHYPVSVIVMDYWVEGTEAAEMGEKIKRFHPQIPFFFFTGDAQSKSREKGLRTGAQGYLLKPDDLNNIVTTIGGFLNSSKQYVA